MADLDQPLFAPTCSYCHYDQDAECLVLVDTIRNANLSCSARWRGPLRARFFPLIHGLYVELESAHRIGVPADILRRIVRPLARQVVRDVESPRARAPSDGLRAECQQPAAGFRTPV